MTKERTMSGMTVQLGPSPSPRHSTSLPLLHLPALLLPHIHQGRTKPSSTHPQLRKSWRNLRKKWGLSDHVTLRFQSSCVANARHWLHNHCVELTEIKQQPSGPVLYCAVCSIRDLDPHTKGKSRMYRLTGWLVQSQRIKVATSKTDKYLCCMLCG